MKKLITAMAIVALMVSVTSATTIGFSPAEGYVDGDLAGQPGSGITPKWECTTNSPSSIFNVSHSSTQTHTDYLKINLSPVHGSSSEPTTVDYATKRMIPMTGQFTAGFSVKYSTYADDEGDETCIALSQHKESGWGVYLGMNKTSNNSMAYHNGTEWVEIANGIADRKWYKVELSGDIATGLFDIDIYLEEDSSLIATVSDLSFRDDPTSLGYVMLTNDGSSKDTGAYLHYYDDLYAVPEPTTIAMLCLGGLAFVRTRKSA